MSTLVTPPFGLSTRRAMTCGVQGVAALGLEKIGPIRRSVEPPTITHHVAGEASVLQLAARGQPGDNLPGAFDIGQVTFDISTGAKRCRGQAADRGQQDHHQRQSHERFDERESARMAIWPPSRAKQPHCLP